MGLDGQRCCTCSCDRFIEWCMHWCSTYLIWPLAMDCHHVGRIISQHTLTRTSFYLVSRCSCLYPCIASLVFFFTRIDSLRFIYFSADCRTSAFWHTGITTRAESGCFCIRFIADTELSSCDFAAGDAHHLARLNI